MSQRACVVLKMWLGEREGAALTGLFQRCWKEKSDKKSLEVRIQDLGMS